MSLKLLLDAFKTAWMEPWRFRPRGWRKPAPPRSAAIPSEVAWKARVLFAVSAGWVDGVTPQGETQRDFAVQHNAMANAIVALVQTEDFNPPHASYGLSDLRFLAVAQALGTMLASEYANNPLDTVERAQKVMEVSLKVAQVAVGEQVEARPE